MTVRVEKPSVNLREKLAELDKPTGIAGEAMLRAETPQEQFNLIGAGRRNLIINGDFQVSQRGNYASATSAAAGEYYLDRWAVNHGVTSTIQQTTDVPSGTPFSYSAKYAATASGTTDLNLLQKIEDVSVLKGQTVTISAWVKSNTSNCRILVYQGSGGGWNSASITHSGGGDWEYLTLPVQISSSANEVRVYFCLRTALAAAVSIANGDYIQITGVQLELGKVATPFEHRSYGEELALCQRYFERQSYVSGSIIAVGYATNSSNAIAVLNYTEKRDAPAITLPSASTTDGIAFLTASNSFPATLGTHTAGNINKHSCRINGGSYSSVTSQSPSALYVTGAQVIDINAEL